MFNFHKKETVSLEITDISSLIMPATFNMSAMHQVNRYAVVMLAFQCKFAFNYCGTVN